MAGEDGSKGADAKPEVLQESRFTVSEGWAYRACRGGAILLNKLFFACIVLLVVWWAWAGLRGDTSCAAAPAAAGNLTDPAYTAPRCNVFLTPTSAYLGGMAIVSFLLSIGCGLLGLVVGKNIVELKPATEEVGAGPKEKSP